MPESKQNSGPAERVPKKSYPYYELLVLSPNPPDTGCGLGDYSNLILDLCKNRQARLIAQNRPLTPKISFIENLKFASEVLAATKRGQSTVVVLNYSAWGYQKYGVPLHLVALAYLLRLRRQYLVTFFHELWSSTYERSTGLKFGILNGLQKSCVWAIARASNLVATSTADKAKALEKIYGGEVIVSAVPSNIKPGRIQRPHVAVAKYTVLVFGRPNTRSKSLAKNKEFLKELNACSRLRRLYIVGEDVEKDIPIAVALGIPKEIIQGRGFLSNAEVSRVMRDSDFLLSAYPAKDIGKSGTLQAAIVHGVIPIFMPCMDGESICPVSGIEIRLGDLASRQIVETRRRELIESSMRRDDNADLKKLVKLFLMRRV